MILIFDTKNGLCNQMFDIIAAVNYCCEKKIYFSFRYASFRYNNMTQWYDVEFNKLFNDKLFKKFKYYVEFSKLKMTKDNTYNYDGDMSDIDSINYEYVIISQFWTKYSIKNKILNVLEYIEPCEKIMNTFNKIYEDIKLTYIDYNFVHYRYENDFLFHHDVKPITFDEVMKKVKFDDNYIIYIATTEIYNIMNEDELKKYLYKDETLLMDYNIEERAFIDFMMGKYANTVYGHSKSSFSMLLNELKMTHNYY
jgi:hypothetical protein